MSSDSYLVALAWPSVSVVGALLVYGYQGFQVGRARHQYGIEAPATTGNKHFERVFRAHQNTLESLASFIPSVYLASFFFNPKVAAGVGAVYTAGRLLYGIGYTTESRTAHEYGFRSSFIASTVLLGLGMYGLGKFLCNHRQ